MPNFSEQVVDDSGYRRPVEGAMVYLLDRSGALSVTTGPNPTTTDNFGVFNFTATDGVYIFSVRQGGIEIARGNAIIGNPPEYTGPPGPADNTYATYAALLASDPARKSARLVPQSGETEPAGNFSYLGGKWVRQTADGITFKQPTAGAVVRNTQEELAAVGARPAQFGADLTGATDATAQVTAWLARGGELYIPQGDVYQYRGNLSISKSGSRIVGGGRLVVTADVANKEAIIVAADDCLIEGITVANPSKVNPRTGDQTNGISIRGNRNRIQNCTVLDFQMGITVQVTGEYFDNVIAFNYVRVIGAGAGPTALTDSMGEDRGIGIADYGARTRIVGNTVQAAEALYSFQNGSLVPGNSFNDCCLGIVSEGLDNFAGDQSSPDISSGSELIGNIVVPSKDGKGRFRRCISIEGGRHTRVIGNYCRGWTWNGIWLVGNSSNSIVEANNFVGDTPTDDRTGAIWGPVKSAIHVYVQGGVRLANARVHGNILEMRTNLGNGIVLYAITGGILRDISVTDNRCTTGVPMNGDGLIVAGADTGISLAGNTVTGLWANSLQLNNTAGVVVRGGWLSGANAAAITGASVTQAEIAGVTMSDCRDGISVTSGSYLLRNNTFYRIGRFALIGETISNIAFVGNAYENGAATTYFFNSTVRAVSGNLNFPVFGGSQNYTPAAIADGTGVSVDVSTPMAMPGDRVRVSYSQPLQGVVAIGAVKAAGTVTARLQNWTGAAVTLAAGTISVAIERGV